MARLGLRNFCRKGKKREGGNFHNLKSASARTVRALGKDLNVNQRVLGDPNNQLGWGCLKATHSPLRKDCHQQGLGPSTIIGVEKKAQAFGLQYTSVMFQLSGLCKLMAVNLSKVSSFLRLLTVI